MSLAEVHAMTIPEVAGWAAWFQRQAERSRG